MSQDCAECTHILSFAVQWLLPLPHNKDKATEAQRTPGRDSPSIHQLPSLLLPIHTARARLPVSSRLGVTVWLSRLQWNMGQSKGYPVLARAVGCPPCACALFLPSGQNQHAALEKHLLKMSDFFSVWFPEPPPGRDPPPHHLSHPPSACVKQQTNLCCVCPLHARVCLSPQRNLV